MKTIQELASEYASLFITKTRDNGDKFLCLKDKSNDEKLTDNDACLSQFIYMAHDGMLPDDYKYQFIHDALEAIAETDDIDDISLEPDCYNRDLLKWLSSNLIRASYVDRAMEEIHPYDNLWQALSNGQYLEKEEVLQSVISSLNEIIESQEDTE